MGREVPDDNDPKNQRPATLFSSKVLLVNHRDLATPSNILKINQTLDKAGQAAIATLNIADEMQAVLGLSDGAINKSGVAFTSEQKHSNPPVGFSTAKRTSKGEPEKTDYF